MNAATRTDAHQDAFGTVLVVEDEVLIRLDFADHLRLAGYKVIEASSGDEAITVLRSIDAISLVISDIRMPGSTDGMALAAWIRRRVPNMKIILVSGEHLSASAPALADFAFRKPVHPVVLVRKAKELLEDEES